jgi:fatty acid omega-hydroxylase
VSGVHTLAVKAFWCFAMTLAVLTRSAGAHLRKAILAAVVFAFYKQWKQWRLRPRGVPINRGLSVFGNMLEFLWAVVQKRHHDYLYRVHQRLGPTFASKMPSNPSGWIVITSCPKNVEHILKINFENYPKGPRFYTSLLELLGNGIFNVDGKEWLHQRKTASKMFTAHLFKEHIWAVVRRNARTLRNILDSVKPDEVVDVFNLMNRFTLDTIGEIGFGKCIGSLEDSSSPFLESFDRAQQVSLQRIYNPFWQVLRRLGIGEERDACEHFKRLDDYSRSVVRELCSNIASDPATVGGVAWADIEARKSFIGLFLEDAHKRGEHLSETFLRDLVLNFLIAGRDTTAQALSWTLYCLSRHPVVEAKARQEVTEICGVRGPAYEDMTHLPYLQAVLSEALRLYPSVPWDIKAVVEDDTLPDGTFIHGGSDVMYDIYSMGRDPTIWGDDAEVFRPDRWLEMQEAPGNYHYPVFNAGPRECLGRRMALVEMRTCLAMLLPHFSFKPAVPDDEITPDAQLTIGMGRGLPCFVVRVTDKEDLASTASATAQSECTTAHSEETPGIQD